MFTALSFFPADNGPNLRLAFFVAGALRLFLRIIAAMRWILMPFQEETEAEREKDLRGPQSLLLTRRLVPVICGAEALL